MSTEQRRDSRDARLDMERREAARASNRLAVHRDDINTSTVPRADSTSSWTEEREEKWRRMIDASKRSAPAPRSDSTYREDVADAVRRLVR